jgi:hypothetical protein
VDDHETFERLLRRLDERWVAGDLAEAEGLVGELERLRPGDPTALLARAQQLALTGAGGSEEGRRTVVALLRSVVDAGPRHPAVLVKPLLIAVDLGAVDLARELAGAIEQHPEPPLEEDLPDLRWAADRIGSLDARLSGLLRRLGDPPGGRAAWGSPGRSSTGAPVRFRLAP